MEIRKKERTVLRAAVTRSSNELEKLFASEVLDAQGIEVNWDILCSKFEALKMVDEKIFTLLLEADTCEEKLSEEMESSDVYLKKFTAIKLRYYGLKQDKETVISISNSDDIKSVSGKGKSKRKFKLPKIEFKKYGGDIKGWLPFWNQFRKVHDDDEIELCDKIQYLVQGTLPDSPARRIVESFPAIDENYEKIVTCLQSRFGREDLQIEVYVRELLKLIIHNAVSNDKLNISVLYDKIETQLRSLETLGITTEKSSAMLFPLIESCLPEELLRTWQRANKDNIGSFNSTVALSSNSVDDAPQSTNRLENLLNFLRSEVENEQRITIAAEGFGLPKINDSNKKRVKKVEESTVHTAAGLVNYEIGKCIFCNNSHPSANCVKVKNFSYDKKLEILAKNKACFRCLKVGHQSRYCRQRLRCVVCGRPHVVLMCPKLPANGTTPNLKPQEEVIAIEQKPDERKDVNKEVNLANYTSAHVFLQTLKVVLTGPKGIKEVRALIDSGSQHSYVLKSTVNELGIVSKGSEKISHALFGGATTAVKEHKCYDVKVCDFMNFSRSFEVLDVENICCSIPPVFSGPWTQHLEDLGVEIKDKEAGSIELLFGADVSISLETGKRHVLECGLVAVETVFGWTLIGRSQQRDPSLGMIAISMLNVPQSIEDLWSLDIIGIKDPVEQKSKKEIHQEVLRHFEETVDVTEEGRYVVHMPWLQGHAPLPSNFDMAYRRLKLTKNKLENEGLLDAYEDVFSNWIGNGIIEQVNYPDTKQGHYLPHRHVVKPNSTTKIRPVFDASARQKGCPSLNDCVESGPNFIELIPNVLNRFRMRKIGISADIKKAFLQIELHDNDRDFLRFLWEDRNGQLKVYRHRRVVFGVSCSPFLLGAVIDYHLRPDHIELIDKGKQLCTRNTIERLRNSFYVDNCLTSLDSEEEVKSFAESSTQIMALGKFDLRGWEFTEKYDEQLAFKNSDQDINRTSLVLGLHWHRDSDTLSISLQDISIVGVVTKRVILSIAQRVFDPIGFSCPVTLQAKLLLRRIWQGKICWDEEVPETISKEFLMWLEELHLLSEIRLPRWLSGTVDPNAKRSLHLFCDASQFAYAAVLYLRVESDDGVSVQLVQAKARVAPIKQISIPRLELLAATIGARLYANVLNSMDRIDESVFWTDSSTVIAWINRKDQWGPFVGNRIKEIRTLTNNCSWTHVPGSFNPADLPSRGCSSSILLKSRWWEGPLWLKESSCSWPKSTCYEDEEEINKEKKKAVTSMINAEASESLLGEDWFYRKFSSFKRIVRLVAWIYRFFNNARKKNIEGELLFSEIEDAEIRIFKLTQEQSFNGLKDNRIKNLCPFVDDKGVMRLKTKIVQRDDTYAFRCPVLLPSCHPVVVRLIREEHIKACHAGGQILLSILREKFWILRGRKTVRSVVKGCVVCNRQNAKRLESIESALPIDRVRDASAFEVTGVDLAGPLYLKDGRKAWVCLFTCAIYRAIHLELLTSLSTDCFLQGFRRFVARRGRPAVIFSDNGLNFVGAENAFSALDWERIKTVQRIDWRFIPPTAPWWGGWWERLVGILKQLLRKVLGKAKLQYEELVTVLCDCEAVINSRPITYLSESPEELSPLTPAMYIQDVKEIGLPDCDKIEGEDLKRRARYRSKVSEDLRKRFRSEYLGQLRQHRFGSKRIKVVKVGEIVLIGSDNSKRLDWPLGRITEIIPGKDGEVRLVKLQTATGQLLRPVQRLYPLEVVSTAEVSAPIIQEHESEEDLRVNEEVRTRCGRKINAPLKLDL